METQTGFQCTMTCNDGYYFYEQSGNGSLVDSLTYTCTFDNSFNIDKMPDCVCKCLAKSFSPFMGETLKNKRCFSSLEFSLFFPGEKYVFLIKSFLDFYIAKPTFYCVSKESV